MNLALNSGDHRRRVCSCLVSRLQLCWWLRWKKYNAMYWVPIGLLCSQTTLWWRWQWWRSYYQGFDCLHSATIFIRLRRVIFDRKQKFQWTLLRMFDDFIRSAPKLQWHLSRYTHFAHRQRMHNSDIATRVKQPSSVFPLTDRQLFSTL